MRRIPLNRMVMVLLLGVVMILGPGGGAEAADDMKYVQADGLRIAYTEYGQGRPLVLIHGGGLTSAMWAEQIPVLAEKFHVLVPDTRGHGKTNNPDHAFSYELLAEDVMAFCHALGVEKPVLMGYSDGGIVALTAGVRHPGFARALVVGGAVPPFGEADRKHYFEGMHSFYAPVKGGSVLTDEHLDAMYAEAPESWEVMARMHAKPGQPDYWRTLMKDVWNTWNTPESYAYTSEQLRGVNIPALVILGDRDDFFLPSSAARLAALLPEGELAVVPRAAHNVFHAKPGLFNALVMDFLERTVVGD